MNGITNAVKARRVALFGILMLLGLGTAMAAEPVSPPAAISMAELHKFGGVPPGWRFASPSGDVAAGRRAFGELGCNTCHVVQGESFPAATAPAKAVGPELTGMGSHHPPEYFAESILNPNAVITSGPGYVGADGRSTMPTYPSMTLQQLADLVAYLGSLKNGEAAAPAHCAAGPAQSNAATVFFTQAFEIRGDKLDGFYDWFEAQRFREHPGLLSIQTYAGRKGEANIVLTVLGFDNEVALSRFVAELDKQPKNSFVRPVESYLLRTGSMYRVDGMSTR